MKVHRVKLFVDSIIEGPGPGHRSQVMLAVNVFASSYGDAKRRTEETLSKLLQDALERDGHT